MSQKILSGSLIAVAISLLALISYLLIGKFSAPTPFAKYLPADSTFFFAEIQTSASPEWSALKSVYAGLSPTTLFDLGTLNFSAPEKFAVLVGAHAGIAFFGAEFNPENYLLVLDTDNTDAMRNFLASEALPDEKLITQKIAGVDVYAYPRSRAQVFAFVGNDLLFSANLKILGEALATRAGDMPRVADSATYQAIVNTLNPRSLGFGYFSEPALTSLITARFDGLENAFATPLVGLFQSGGFTLTPEQNSVKLKTFFALRAENIRKNLFVNVAPYHSSLVNVVPSEAQTFYGTQNLADALEKLLVASETLNPNFALLARGTLERLTQKFFGSTTHFSPDLTSVLGSEIIVGVTQAGEKFALLTGSGIAQKFLALKTKILATNPTLLATPKTVTLPDDSTGTVLVVPEQVSETSINFGSYEIHRVIYGAHSEWNYALVADTVLVSESTATLEKMLTELGTPRAEITLNNAQDLFFTHLNPSATQLPLLAPFQTLSAGKQIGADGVTIDFILNK